MNLIKKIIGVKYDSLPQDNKARLKIGIIMLVFTFAFVILTGRIAWIQFVRGDYYRKEAYEQQNLWRTIPATRGTIYDRNGNVLAISVSACQISVNPKTILAAAEKYANSEIEKIEEKIQQLEESGKYIEASKIEVPTVSSIVPQYQKMVADGLADILGLDPQKVLQSVQDDGRYKIIARKQDNELGDKVREWKSQNNIKGVYIDEDTQRYYPYGSLASHLLGFTGTDDVGLVCGVEVSMNSYLTGTNGRIITAVDASGNELPFDEITRLDPVDGYNVTMTIDYAIQSMAEEALKDAIAEYNVQRGGTIIVMDPNNGDVLAMASYPDFNPNDPYAEPEGYQGEEWNGHTQEDVNILSATVWRNKALSDTYEPGSTFKTITSAAALEEGVVKLTTMMSDSPLKLSGWTINCWRKEEHHGDETFADAIKNSCNPVFSKVSLLLGLEKFYQYVEAFGFMDKTGIQLSGEANSIFHAEPTEIDMAVAAFGQRMVITPIQLATAYCAIANGGTLYTPRIVKNITDDQGVMIKSYESTAVRQVISEKTSRDLLYALERVVSEGTGSNAYVAGYRVAGKTGTSETMETESEGRYIASFCGIAPADDPQVVVLVVLDHPVCDSVGGGAQAAPVASKLFEKILEYKNVERKYTEADKQNLMVRYYLPDVTGMTVDEAIKMLKSKTFTAVIPDLPQGADTSSVIVREQTPKFGIYLVTNSEVILYVTEEPVKKQVVVPDVKGYTLEEAYHILTTLGLNVEALNTGTVAQQNIAPGTEVELGSRISLTVINEDIETSESLNGGIE